MSEGATAVATRQFCVEGLKKAALCAGAAVAVGAALPYSFAFAFQAMTYLGFGVALAEGLFSVLAEMLDDPDWAHKKITEAVETLCASLALVAVQATYLAVS
jgi:hypothetical protein